MMNSNLPYWFCNKGTTCDTDHFESGQIIECIKEVSLTRLKDGRFQILEFGAFRNILEGPNYLIVDNTIAEVLKNHVPEQIKVNPITVFRRATGETWTNYSEFIPLREIDYLDYYTTVSSGLKIYHMMLSMIYVSQDLKIILERELADFSDLEFKQGIPVMAG